MPNPILPPSCSRFLAVDLHKDYAVVGGVNHQLDTVLSPRRIEIPAWPRWAAANLIPEVWVPPIVVRDARGLLAHRRRLVRNRSMVSNRLQSLLLRHNLPAPEGNSFSLANLPWWETLPVSPTEKLRICQDLATLEHLSAQIVDLDAEIARLSTQAP